MNFYSFGLSQLADWLTLHSFSKNHARKIFQFFYKEKKTITDLKATKHIFPKELIEKLAIEFDFCLPTITRSLKAHDGTYKLLLEFSDKRSVETVIIPFFHKYTICLSTQVGCAMNCSFCYTGTQGLTRNLEAHEIVGLYLKAYMFFEEVTQAKQRRPNIVYMGQGEPLHNFDAVKKATEIFLETYGLELGPRNITISTAGYLPGLKKFHEFPRINLALSLHSAFDEKRSKLIPINQHYPLAEILSTIQSLPRLKRQYIMCEYLLIDKFNDHESDALKLIETLQKLPVIINLIPFNPYPGSPYNRPHLQKINEFKSLLEIAKIPTLIRTTKGDDILAACGQLYVDELNRKKSYSAAN